MDGWYLERLYLYCRSSREGLSEADHTHVVCVLLQTARVLVAAVQTRQAGVLVLHSSTGVTTGMGFTAGQFSVLLRETTGEKLVRLLNYSNTKHTLYNSMLLYMSLVLVFVPTSPHPLNSDL